MVERSTVYMSFTTVCRLPGVKKPLNQYGGGDAGAADEDDDGDVDDLFGSDNEEDVEAIRQQRLKEYAAKKSASVLCYIMFKCMSSVYSC